MFKKNKIIVVLGTTASGKTKLGVYLARQFKGEIISADSRQVYRGLDVGAGKDLCEYGEVKYHLIDIADPKDRYSVVNYQNDALAAITDVLQRGKLPIICGGSGQYLQAVVDNYKFTEIKPNIALRAELEKKGLDELFVLIKEKNSAFAAKINDSDRKNKRRLIRYAEINLQSFIPGFKKEDVDKNKTNKGEEYDFFLIGLTWPKEILAERIHKRLLERLAPPDGGEDMIREVSDLHDKAGLSWKRLESFGLDYKFIALYLQEKIDYDQMAELLERAINQFAKKQITWFSRWEKQGRKINWIKSGKEADKLTAGFLNG